MASFVVFGLGWAMLAGTSQATDTEISSNPRAWPENRAIAPIAPSEGGAIAGFTGFTTTPQLSDKTNDFNVLSARALQAGGHLK